MNFNIIIDHGSTNGTMTTMTDVGIQPATGMKTSSDVSESTYNT